MANPTGPFLSEIASRSASLTVPVRIPARRLRPETLDRETALEQAKAVARDRRL